MARIMNDKVTTSRFANKPQLNDASTASYILYLRGYYFRPKLEQPQEC